MIRTRRVALTLVIVLAGLVVGTLAQDQTSEFRPVLPGELAQDQIPAARLVFAAYGFAWATFVVYGFFLWRRMRRVEADLTEISAKLGARRG